MEPKVRSGPYSTPQKSTRLRVSWNAFPIAFLAEDLDAMLRSQVYHCHEFVKSVAIMESEIAIKKEKDAANKPDVPRPYPYDKARKLLQRCRHEGARSTLEEEFPTPPTRRQSLTLGRVMNIFRRWRKTRLEQASYFPVQKCL